MNQPLLIWRHLWTSWSCMYWMCWWCSFSRLNIDALALTRTTHSARELKCQRNTHTDLSSPHPFVSRFPNESNFYNWKLRLEKSMCGGCVPIDLMFTVSSHQVVNYHLFHFLWALTLNFLCEVYVRACCFSLHQWTFSILTSCMYIRLVLKDANWLLQPFGSFLDAWKSWEMVDKKACKVSKLQQSCL